MCLAQTATVTLCSINSKATGVTEINNGDCEYGFMCIHKWSGVVGA